MNRVEKHLTRKLICGEYIRTAVWRLWLNKKYRLDFGESLSERKLKTKVR
jgi:hypothetical protein